MLDASRPRRSFDPTELGGGFCVLTPPKFDGQNNFRTRTTFTLTGPGPRPSMRPRPRVLTYYWHPMVSTMVSTTRSCTPSGRLRLRESRRDSARSRLERARAPRLAAHPVARHSVLVLAHSLIFTELRDWKGAPEPGTAHVPRRVRYECPSAAWPRGVADKGLRRCAPHSLPACQPCRCLMLLHL